MTCKSVCASVAFLVAAALSGMSCFLHEWADSNEGSVGLFQVCSKGDEEICSWIDNDPSTFCRNASTIADDYKIRVLRMQVAATLTVSGFFLFVFAALISSPVLERYNYMNAIILGLIGTGCSITAVSTFGSIDRQYICFSEDASFHYAFGLGIASCVVGIIASIIGFQTPSALLKLWGRVNN